MNKFFYIDDNDPSLNEGIIADLNSIGKDDAHSVGLIEVFFKVAQAWDKEVELLQSEQYDGLLLDWKLGTIVKYDAEALASHVRTLISTGTIQKDIPLLLCSATKHFKTIFARDQSSHNLFLSIHTKLEIANNAAQIAIEMNDLAEAFKQIQLTTFKKEALLLVPEKIRIDLRLEGEITALLENKIPHNLVQFILLEVINKPGPLINENILAARLGIDRDKSEDWPNLLTQHLSAFTYNGILSNGWKRWWAEGLEQWWESEISTSSLRSKSAKQRVKLLIEKTGLKNLVHAEKDKFCFGTEFWTVCIATNRPLDPIDGLRIIPKTPILPWQEEQFISPHGLLENGMEFLKNNNLRLNPFELERWENIRRNSKE
jgi:hypothetical protein